MPCSSITITARLTPSAFTAPYLCATSLSDVRQQRHVERVLGDEILVRGQVLRGDAHDGGVQRSEVARPVAVGAELFGADHRVVARVEQQHDALAAMLGELEAARGARQLEVRRLLADLRRLGHLRHPTRMR